MPSNVRAWRGCVMDEDARSEVRRGMRGSGCMMYSFAERSPAKDSDDKHAAQHIPHRSMHHQHAHKQASCALNRLHACSKALATAPSEKNIATPGCPPGAMQGAAAHP